MDAIITEEGFSYKTGEEYEFAKNLQTEKSFKVEWEKGTLKGYLHLNGSFTRWHYDQDKAASYIRPIHKLNAVIDELDFLIINDFTVLKEHLKGVRDGLSEVRDKDLQKGNDVIIYSLTKK